MTPREAVLNALMRQPTGRIPAALVGGGMWSVHHYGTTFEDLSRDPVRMSDMLVEMSGRLRSDIVYVGSGYPNFPVASLGGRIKYRPVGAPDLEGPIISTGEDLDRLDITAIDRDAVIHTIRQAFLFARERIGAEYLVTLTAWGPFTLGARLIGEEVMMKAIFRRPDFVARVLESSTAILRRFFEPVLRDRSLEVILLGEPTASGDLISRAQFDRFVVPHLRAFTRWAGTFGASTILHVCGNTTDRLDLFPATGAACVSLDHKTDIARAREVLGGRMCFAGNIDPVQVLLQGSAEDVRTACLKTLGTAGTGGGFILMPGCDIPPTVPYENIVAFMNTAREWGS